MKLLKMYWYEFGKWTETTFEAEKKIIAVDYHDIEIAKEKLAKGDILITAFSTYKVPKNEIKKERS